MPRAIENVYSGNCNFQYISGLSNYFERPKQALLDLLYVESVNFMYDANFRVNGTKKIRNLQFPTCGMYLFAQESTTSPRLYAHQFRDYILENKLGTVTMLEAANPCHGNRIGTLFIWVIDRAALKKWCLDNVPEGATPPTF